MCHSSLLIFRAHIICSESLLGNGIFNRWVLPFDEDILEITVLIVM